MEQDSQQYLDAAKTGIELAHKTGVLNRLFGLFSSRQSIEPSQPVDQPQPQMDFRERALTALLENAVDTLASLELTFQEAVHILGPDFSFEDLSKVNSTWQRHWLSGASNVGVEDEDRHVWWGRLVAGEIQQPGTFSLRTLAVMDTLSTQEAQLFTRLCDYVWVTDHPVLISPKDNSQLWTPSFSEITKLENCGLLMSTISNYSLKSSRIWQETSYMQLTLINDSYRVEIPEGQSGKLRRGKLQLTEVGQEVYRLTTPGFLQSYCDEILEEWRRSYTVHQLPVVHL